MSALLDIANSLPDTPQNVAAPSTGSKLMDLANMPGTFKNAAQKPVDTRQPSGLTLGMDPSKFGAVASGLASTVPDSGLNLNSPMQPQGQIQSIPQQTAPDTALHPNYATAGKVLGTSLMGGLGGAEAAPFTAASSKAPLLMPLIKGISKGAGMADLSQGGASAGQAMFPGNPIAGLLGGLAAPLGAAGAMGGIKSIGSALAGTLAKPTDETSALQSLSTQFNVPMSVGDLTGQEGKGVGGLERVLEKTPFSGMVKFRAGQQAALNQAGTGVVNTFANAVPETAMDDPQQALQGYIGNSEAGVRAQATAKYNDFLSKAAQADGKVSLTNLKTAAQQVVNREQALPAQMRTPAFATAQSILEMPDQVGIGLASTLDQRLGGLSNAASKQFGMGNVTKDALHAYGSMDAALGGENGDIAAFAKTQPNDIVGAYNDAKSFYRENVGPFNDPDIRKLGSNNFDTDTLLNKMVKNNRPQLAQKLIEVLPPDGQATLKYSVVNKLMEQANYGSDTKPFSPQLFSNAWNKLGATQDALFTPQEKQMISGYTKLINAAPGPMANPRTGAENTGLLGLVALKEFAGTVGMKAAIPMLAGGRALTSMLTQPWGQRMLLTAAQTNDKGLIQRLAAAAAMNMKASASNPGTVSASSQRTFGLPAPQTSLPQNPMMQAPQNTGLQPQ